MELGKGVEREGNEVKRKVEKGGGNGKRQRKSLRRKHGCEEARDTEGDKEEDSKKISKQNCCERN